MKRALLPRVPGTAGLHGNAQRLLPAAPGFGSLFRAIRIKHGLSQEAAAKQCGMAQRSFWLWESGQRLPSMTGLARYLTGVRIAPEDALALLEAVGYPVRQWCAATCKGDDDGA